MLYHGSTSLYLTLMFSIIALFHFTSPYNTLPILYFTLYFICYITIACLYLILFVSTAFYNAQLYFTLHDPTSLYTWLYRILQKLYFPLRDSTLLYHGSTYLYWTLYITLL